MRGKKDHAGVVISDLSNRGPCDDLAPAAVLFMLIDALE
jgi:hypothetical protein